MTTGKHTQDRAKTPQLVQLTQVGIKLQFSWLITIFDHTELLKFKRFEFHIQ